jgi:hypothetical protein
MPARWVTKCALCVELELAAGLLRESSLLVAGALACTPSFPLAGGRGRLSSYLVCVELHLTVGCLGRNTTLRQMGVFAL